jgi:hypothetical protein
MKKVLSIVAVAVLATSFVSCGPSAEELAKKEQMKQDSIAKATAAADSVAAAVAAASADSLAMATKMADSIKMVDSLAKAGKK